MTLEDFSAGLRAMAPALSNHLWQSTLFGFAAWLLTLALGKNRAASRYWVWLVASAKFLLPFSLLSSLGGHLAWSLRANTTGDVYFVIEEIVRPAASSGLPHLLPELLVAIWLSGLIVVLSVSCARWRRVSQAMTKATLLRRGREVDILQRLERRAGMEAQIAILSSGTSLEPGIFGISHPVLLWPQGMSKNLDEAGLEAILAHELCHVRRRDNLAALAQMVIEAIFWFHPLLWWIGGRLIEERERACDEEVLEMGSDRQVYAESILKVCEFCVGSPLACVSGVTGSDLKKRMVHIMTNEVVRKLNFSKRLMLGAAGFLAVALPIVFGLINATPGQAQIQNGNAEAATKSTHPMQVPKDVMQGMIREKVPPQYPADARKNHIQGIVVLKATISKEGNVENLVYVSGPKELTPASIEAVKDWKYKPYRVDGKPVEVETEVLINFTLAG